MTWLLWYIVFSIIAHATKSIYHEYSNPEFFVPIWTLFHPIVQILTGVFAIAFISDFVNHPNNQGEVPTWLVLIAYAVVSVFLVLHVLTLALDVLIIMSQGSGGEGLLSFIS